MSCTACHWDFNSRRHLSAEDAAKKPAAEPAAPPPSVTPPAPPQVPGLRFVPFSQPITEPKPPKSAPAAASTPAQPPNTALRSKPVNESAVDLVVAPARRAPAHGWPTSVWLGAAIVGLAACALVALLSQRKRLGPDIKLAFGPFVLGGNSDSRDIRAAQRVQVDAFQSQALPAPAVPQASASQHWVFEGKIHDRASLAAVVNARLVFIGPDGRPAAETLTGPDGSYRIELAALPSGGYAPQLKHPDYLERLLDDSAPPLPGVPLESRKSAVHGPSAEPMASPGSGPTQRNLVAIPRSLAR